MELYAALSLAGERLEKDELERLAALLTVVNLRDLGLAYRPEIQRLARGTTPKRRSN